MSPIDTEHTNPHQAFHLVLDARRRQQALCDDLELLADHLGQRLDYHLTEKCRHYLASDLMLHQKDEEAVFNLLQLRRPSVSVSRLINLAVAEHERHREYALEVNECLGELSEGGRNPNTEALAYLLRATFENIRQHLEWEEVTLFQDARHAIAAASHDELAKQLAMNRQGRPSRLWIID